MFSCKFSCMAAICLLVWSPPIALAQPGATFDLQAYQNFLASHRDLTASELLARYPAANFRDKIGHDLTAVAYLDTIRQIYKLTNDELALLKENGFMVTERLASRSFGQAYLEIYRHDLPVFVSTDALLHALHKSYDAILQDTELGVLIPRLKDFLAQLYAAWPVLANTYATRPEMQPMLNDIDVYLNVALRLLGENMAPQRPENLATINQLLALIAAERPADYKLFSATPRTIDFSQFRPRGHYTNDERLKKYFKAMIWLGRTELMLTKPKVQGGWVPSEADIQRQIIDSFILLEAAKVGDAVKIWQEIDGVIRFLVGESDNVTLAHLQLLADEIGLAQASELLDATRLQAFQKALAAKSYAIQRINSQILLSDPMNPEQIAPPSAFLLFGQRFVIDSYVMGNVVYDRILYQGRKVWRELPSSLDVLFALGNDAAAVLLKNDFDQYHYAANAAALRYLIDSYEENFWNSALYNVWLQAIRKLGPPNDLSSLPAFMQTGAFWQEKMNTQLAAWAQLRHDNLLYAKQFYTSGVSCSFPYSFVEPFPEFYRTLRDFAGQAQANFSAINFAEAGTKSWILHYFSQMAGVMDTLATVAEKQLERTPLSTAETSFLKSMLFESRMCGEPLRGWYPNLFYNGPADCEALDLVVADVHTAPTDEFGNMVGHILHAGTGLLNLGIVIAECEVGKPIACIGPVMSYYEHVTTNFQRLTDEEWQAFFLYQKSPPVRPAWVNAYLADANGRRRTAGPRLVTSVKETLAENEAPVGYLLHQNFPNPFNAGTVIRFEIPASLENTSVRLAVYNVRGELICELINRPDGVGTGNYFARWEGKDDAGREVASGIYFCRLQVGSVSEMRKLTLLK
ncbi:MAG: DUF3160 domain-containing protein [candidate division KSB1 bacterium]|nr:DUF3160 domain-containing protein [candidate division KSB1 bacterium]